MALLPVTTESLDDVVRVTPQFFAFRASVDKWHGKSYQWILRTVGVRGVFNVLSVISLCVGLVVV